MLYLKYYPYSHPMIPPCVLHVESTCFEMTSIVIPIPGRLQRAAQGYQEPGAGDLKAWISLGGRHRGISWLRTGSSKSGNSPKKRLKTNFLILHAK